VPKRKPIVGFDINGTLDDSMRVFMENYNEKFGANVKYEDLTEYDVRKHFPEVENVFTMTPLEELKEKMVISDSARNFVSKCHDKFDVVFVTAAYPDHLQFWFEMLRDAFPWVRSEHLIRCSRKQILKLDALIDDAYFNLESAPYMGFLKTQPWNKDICDKYICRFDDFDEALWDCLINILT